MPNYTKRKFRWGCGEARPMTRVRRAPGLPYNHIRPCISLFYTLMSAKPENWPTVWLQCFVLTVGRLCKLAACTV